MADVLYVFERLNALLRAEPFEPFVIVADDAMAYGVKDPSHATLATAQVGLTYPKSGFHVSLPLPRVVACDTIANIRGAGH